MSSSKLIEEFIDDHQYKLYGFIFNRVRNHEDAKDIFQESMVKALTNIDKLRDTRKVNSWILSITSNEIKAFSSRKNQPDFEYSYEVKGIEYEYNDFTKLLRAALNNLSSEKRDVLHLRFYSGLSYEKIAMVCNISKHLVKSRLFEAKKELKKSLPHLTDYYEIDKHYFDHQKESFVMGFDDVKVGSYVLERLDLVCQIDMVLSALESKEFSDMLLEAIGRIDRGKDFIKRYHSKISKREIINILNCCDRFTEKRIIEEMDRSYPKRSEEIKSNMFVFEDIVLCDSGIIRLLVSRVDKKVFAEALKAAPTIVVNHCLSVLEKGTREELIAHISDCESDWHNSLEKQVDIVETIKRMDIDGEIQLQRVNEAGEELVKLVLANRGS